MADHSPHSAAAILGITPITLRRWCDYHKAYLSPSTQSRNGQARRLTGRDIEVLRHVRSLRDQGLTTSIINEQLAGLTFAEIDDQPVVDDLPFTAVDAPVTTVTSPQQAPIEPLAPDYILALERRVMAVEQSREPSFVVGIGIGFIAALLFVIVLIGLAVLYGGFR